MYQKPHFCGRGIIVEYLCAKKIFILVKSFFYVLLSFLWEKDPASFRICSLKGQRDMTQILILPPL